MDRQSGVYISWHNQHGQLELSAYVLNLATRCNWLYEPKEGLWESTALTYPQVKAVSLIPRDTPAQCGTCSIDQWWRVKAVRKTFICYGLDISGIKSRWGWDFPYPSSAALWTSQPPIQWVPGFYPRYSGRDLALTNHLDLASRLRKNRAIPVLPLWVFVTCSRVNFTLTFTLPYYTVLRKLTETFVGIFFQLTAHVRFTSSRWARRYARSQIWWPPVKIVPCFRLLVRTKQNRRDKEFFFL